MDYLLESVTGEIIHRCCIGYVKEDSTFRIRRAKNIRQVAIHEVDFTPY